MTARYQQVFEGRWPSGDGKPIAMLRADPEELERRFGLRFSDGRDDLGEFREAALKLASGRPVLLMRYRHSPGPGTTVSVDRNDNAEDARRELLRTFGLGAEEFSWVADDVDSARRAAPGAGFRVSNLTRAGRQVINGLGAALGRLRIW